MALIELSADLRAVVTAVTIHSNRRYTLAGESRQVSDAIVAGDGPVAEPDLERALLDDLYYRLYCRAGDRSPRRADSRLRRDHVAGLARANYGTGTWEPGWRVRSIEDDGRIEVESGGMSFWAEPSELRPAGDGLAPGDACRARIPAEYRELIPGYYMALGDADQAVGERGACAVRLYWNLRADGAAHWMRELTAGLNRHRIPFRLKALSNPLAYLRADAGVLYLSAAGYRACRDEIERLWQQVQEALRPAVPLFTMRLAPGLGVAEGPGDRSFGRERCRLIAGALVEASEAGWHGEEERCEAVADALRRAGVEPSKPHLAPGSTANYEPFVAGDAKPRRRTGQQPAARSAPKEALLAAARGIGDGLCRTAHWHRDRCNWIGRTSDEGDARTGIVVPTAAVSGPALYGGTAGIGLFLARLFARTGDDAYRRAACGALRRSVAAMRAELDDDDPMSAFTGRLGVAWAARQVASLVDDSELAGWSAETLEHLARKRPGDHYLDLIRGNAGAILVLLDLYRQTRDGTFLDAALALGEEIRALAIQESGSWSWANDRVSGTDPADPPLTGFSHGAAGIALALFELHAVTGHRSWRDGACAAFAYEDGWFDAERGNWRDVRGMGTPGGGRTPDFAVAWCHGAPGIALSRLRAAAIDTVPAESYIATGRRGLATTRRLIESRLAEAGADACLCHGLCGLIEVALVAWQMLGDEDLLSTASSAAWRMVERHTASGIWPSGVASRRHNPSLLIGEAGIGYTLLRLENPDGVPSVLLPGT